jgi:hypothetical protein
MNTQTNEVKETFTMLDDKLLSTPISRITAQQKLLISWVLRFQKNKLECFASNKHIAETFGMSKDGVKSLLKSCSHSFPTFFTCTPDTKDNGVPFHTISIDLEKLIKFIDGDAPVSKIKRRNKPSTENKAQESTISTQTIPEVQVEEIESEIKDNNVRQEIIPILKQRANKHFKDRYNDKHFDNQITDMIEMLEDIYEVKYVDELTDDIIDRLQIELGEPKAFYKVPLFKNQKELV